MTLPPPATDAAVARCPHCEAPIEGPEDRFCCHGCEAAWQLLHDAGLGDWYQRRDLPGARPGDPTHDWSAIPVRQEGPLCSASLAVDGLRCTSCTWVVEHLLQQTDGVDRAHVSYASGRATVRWDPQIVDLPALAGRIAAIGYAPRPVDAAAAPEPLFAHLAVAAFCTANLMLLTAGLYASWIDGMEPRFQALFRWGALALATPVATYSAEPFWRGAWAGLRARTVGMDVPIALAVGVLYVHAVAQTLRGAEGYLDSLGMLVTLLLIGRIVEARGRRSAADAAATIAARLPQTARRRSADGGVEDVSPSALVVGDVLELGPGQEVAADATLIDGAIEVQSAMLTGEVTPRRLTVGDSLYAGTVVLSGAASAAVERAGQATVAMRMADAIREAIDRPATEDPAAALAPRFTAATLVVALAAGAGWTAAAGVATGVEVAVAVLVVACPCALGLSVPLGLSAGLGALARRGVLLRDGDALLRLGDVEHVAIDKTGTLTLGEPTVLEAEDEVLRVAAGLERASSHPIARALTREAVARRIPLPFPTQVVERAGVGVEGTLDGQRYRLRSGGSGAVELLREDAVVGHIRLGDTPRPDAARAIERLRASGLPVTVLSGDDAAATRAIAERLGILAHHGALLPTDKADWLARHPRTLFIGDGLNDGPALANAYVGLAMSSGAGVALGAADGVVSGGGVGPIAVAVHGARATRAAIRTNLRRSLVYNALAVSAAAAGLVNPLVAAVLMPLSSAMVIWGAGAVERTLKET